jgi:hypothetical protein
MKPFGAHKTLASLVEKYAADWYQFDQFQRSFELYTDSLPDRTEAVETFIKRIRQAYRQRSERLQKHYQSLVQQEGWPGSLPMQNTAIWDKFIKPALKSHTPHRLHLGRCFPLRIRQRNGRRLI